MKFRKRTVPYIYANVAIKTIVRGQTTELNLVGQPTELQQNKCKKKKKNINRGPKFIVLVLQICTQIRGGPRKRFSLSQNPKMQKDLGPP
jgi:hypothetical protein